MSLTSAERMVLELVRDGRFDAEIAVRLGLTNEEVKRRIAVICTKLGVDDRAALRGDFPAGFPATEERDDWSPVIDYTVDPLPREEPAEPEPVLASGDRRPFAAIAGMLLAIGVAALAAWFAFDRTDDPEGSDAREPGVSLTDDPGTIISQQIPDVISTQMATYLEPGPGLLVVPATVVGSGLRSFITDFDLLADTLTGTSSTPVPGSRDAYQSVALPPDVELITARGSVDGGVEAIERAFTGADGEVAVETLFLSPNGSTIVSTMASPNGASLAVAVCGGCARLRDDSFARVQLDIYRSDDAGVTWGIVGSRETTQPREWTLVAFVPGDILLRKSLQPPELLSNGLLACGATSSPFIGQGENQTAVVLAPSTGNIVDCGGNSVLETGITGRFVIDAFRSGPDETASISWHTTETRPRAFVGDFEQGDAVVIEVPRLTRIAGWLQDGLAIGDTQLSAEGSITPALIDLTGTVTLLEAPLRAVPAAQAAGQEWRERAPEVLRVLAIRQGTNATVSLPDGVDCGPLMPLTLDPKDISVGCLADGVRVQMSAGSTTVEPGDWAVVSVPGFDATCTVACLPARALMLRSYLQ